MEAVKKVRAAASDELNFSGATHKDGTCRAVPGDSPRAVYLARVGRDGINARKLLASSIQTGQGGQRAWWPCPSQLGVSPCGGT